MLYVAFSMAMTGLAHAKFVAETPENIGDFSFSSVDLCSVSESVLAYLNRDQRGAAAIESSAVMPEAVSAERVKDTLSFLCDVASQHNRAPFSSPLHSRSFLLEHFDFYRWYPEKQQALEWAQRSTSEVKQKLLRDIPFDQILLTRYYVKQIEARDQEDADHPHALYAVPYDESGVSVSKALERRSELSRFRYTRQHVMEGVLANQNLARPLVWVDEDTLHDALLQGTVVFKGDDGNLRYLNVDRNNGIPYDYELGRKEQARYWYFKEVDGVKGYGRPPNDKVDLRAQVSLAGNVAELGLGKLFLVNQANARTGSFQAQLAILADEGGAFDNNLFQLDLLVGNYWGWQDYYEAHKHLGDYASVWLMLKKTKKRPDKIRP